MARPEPWRRDAACYPRCETIQTRFQDLDPLGHINNVAMAAIFESARVRFNRSLAQEAWRGHRWLIAMIEVNYLAEAHFPQDIEIATGIGDISTRSWQVLSAAFQDGQCIATCDAVIVMQGGGGVTALPPDLRAALEQQRATRA